MQTFEREYKQLNPLQRQAVDQIDGPVLVIAGPGTGKTQLLSMRVANILLKTDIDPSNILCLTFTDAAAANMRERLRQLIGPSSSHVAVHTFHSFGTDLIQKYPEYFESSPLLEPIDELRVHEIMYEILAGLPHSNPFSKRVGDDFLHLKSVLQAISWLKQAGFTPEAMQKDIASSQKFIDEAGKLVRPIFTNTPSAALKAEYTRLLEALLKTADCELKGIMCNELENAISLLEEGKKHAKSITAWRNKWLAQNIYKEWMCADQKRLKYLSALSEIYQQFSEVLGQNGWYTYDDMILRPTLALEESDELRLILQERYQYILVDEYQDTNGAQDKLLQLLADHPVHEGRPNVMVVGDDDQAIYRFQGAYMSIMLQFADKWRGVKRVVLQDNYRSAEPVLTLARQVILQGEDRLESHWPELSKELTSRSHHEKSIILRPQTAGPLEQNYYIASEIRSLLAAGIPPEEIAVLAPRHAQLQAIVPFLLAEDIPVSYEKRENILGQAHIRELIAFARLLHHGAKGEWQQVDAYMSEVLAAPYWQISPLVLSSLSLKAYSDSQLWLEVLIDHEDERLKTIGQTIAALCTIASNQPFEVLLDQMLGNSPVFIDKDLSWHVPFKEYYFNEEKLIANPALHLSVLGQLTTLRDKLREYRPEKVLTLSDFIDFIDAYERSGLLLLDTSAHNTSDKAIKLMTVYKAKGLEWDNVFLIGCHDDVWGTKVRSRNESFSLPTHLQWVRPARDSNDDRLRLLYVALTRARHTLYLACYEQNEKGKAAPNISWFDTEEPWLPATTKLSDLTVPDLVTIHEISWQEQFPVTHGDLKAQLKPALESYLLSPTHLNNFLDVTRGGPRHFLLTNLLHFPEAMHPRAAYGDAVHEALRQAHIDFSKSNKVNDGKILSSFQDRLLKHPLTERDYNHLLKLGKDTLPAFVNTSVRFDKNDRSEFDFKREGVAIGKARITGKIDVLRELSNNELEVIDYKTGSPLESWNKLKTDYQKIKAHHYRQQLMFYKLLVEGSATFGKKHVVAKGSLHFTEPNEEGRFTVLDLEFEEAELERFKALIQVVWQKIQDFDLPDVSSYSPTLKGILDFESHLLKEKVMTVN